MPHLCWIDDGNQAYSAAIFLYQAEMEVDWFALVFTI